MREVGMREECQAIIKLEGVGYQRNKKTILSNINLEINNKDFVTIIGPNGAGKSMLLKCIMGFYKPTQGNVVINNDLTIGYMPQKLEVNYMLPIKVADFLHLNQRIDKNYFEHVVDQVGIHELLSRSLHVLSLGQMQRVLMARALLKKPSLLIMDEPAQNLDISGQLSFYRLLDKIYRENQMTILMVSHDLHFVMKSSTTIVCLFHHICYSGHPKVISKDPEFIKAFGNDMSSVLQLYQHDSHHHH